MDAVPAGSLHAAAPAAAGSGLAKLARFARPVALLVAVSLAGCVVAPTHYPDRYGPPRQAAAPTPPPMFFYPERGQAEPQQDRDRYECYRLAVRDSGYDPGMTAFVTQRQYEPQPVVRDGAEVINSAAAGAIIGAAVSSPRQAGNNAIIGAIFGMVLGAIAEESRAQAIEAANARRAEAAQRARTPYDDFRRAMGACMQSRGYRVG